MLKQRKNFFAVDRSDRHAIAGSIHTAGLAVRLSAVLVALVTWALPTQAQTRVDAEAVAGAPFGVGRFTIQSGGDFRINRIPRPGGGRIADLTRRIIDPESPKESAALESTEMMVSEKSGRVLYPVFEKRERPVLKQFINTPSARTVYFLFQGDSPLDLTAYLPEPSTGPLAVSRDPAAHQRLLSQWWRHYSAAAAGSDIVRDYPPMVEEFLVDTLSRRLRLALPEREQSGALESQLNLLFQTETKRLDTARSILLGNVQGQPASQTLPEELPSPQAELLNPAPADTPIEAIAQRVPVECLYVRFGNFPNFLWLRHRMEDWGGELRDVVSERGLNFSLNDRFQRQIGLRESALAEVLGDRVIADVAIIGTDTFMTEGAAMGMLFQAKNAAALNADLTQQRLTAAREAKGSKQEKLTIAGKPVSFISTPDNALRSFHAADGDFHLVTTSRTLVEWFLQTGAGQHPSLGGSQEFRYTRKNMPLTRDDTVFVYLSPQFFQNLLNPRYQIELDRRLRSALEIELYQIAELAARAEKKTGGSIDALIASDLLPVGFGQRPDGSQLVVADGRLSDSLRGARGSFLPVPDMAVDKVTAAETAQYDRFAEVYTREWGAMEPVVAGIQRAALPEGKLERVVVDIQAAPLSKKHIGILNQWLGSPTDQRLAAVPGNVVSFEAVLRGGTFFSGDEHHLFGGLRNADPALALDPRASIIARIFTSKLEGMQGYLGAWPNPGFLRLIGGGPASQPDAAGYSQLITGLWRRQFDDFTLLSFHPEILDQASSQLRFEQATRPAQVWFHADDLAKSTLAPMINAYGYRQSRQITQGNARYMNMLRDQLHVPLAECLSTGERLLSATFETPLGGKYEARELPSGMRSWVATALADRADPNQVPDDYQFQALTWLRGIDFELTTVDGALALHGELIMPVETRAPAFQLPSLPFGPKKPSEAAKPEPKAPPKPAVKASTPAPSQAKPTGRREF